MFLLVDSPLKIPYLFTTASIFAFGFGCTACSVMQSCLTLCDAWTVAHQSLIPWNFPARILELISIFSSRDLPNPGIKPHLPMFGTQILCH